jgi:uncharacterized membrane protein
MKILSVIKCLVVVAIAIGFMNCEQVAKIDAQMDADSTDIANEIADMTNTLEAVERLAEDGESELIFKASGTEPGWIAEYYTDKFKLIVDYGKDSLIIKNISKYFDVNGGYSFSYKNSEGGKEIHLNVKIEDKECIAASGDKKPRTVTVTYNGKIYTGCGESTH